MTYLILFFGAQVPEVYGPQIAPPLSPEQSEQHIVWLQNALVSGGGPLFDDGSLQDGRFAPLKGDFRKNFGL